MSTRSTARALRLYRKADNAEGLQPEIVDVEQPVARPGHAVVEVLAAAVNPSDVKAALGMMPHAVWPRVPGRDYAGRVIAGPTNWLGKEVWGTGGDLGMTRDGTHSRYLVLPIDALACKPESVSLAAAGTVGVPFVTAYEGLRRAGLTGTGQSVVVFGANGKVGQAAIQLASRVGAKVVAIERGTTNYIGHASSEVTLIDGTRNDLADAIVAATNGRGADIAYNTVGSPYFAAALSALAIGGTQILISTIDRSVPFDILAFYRRNLQMLGVDSLKLSAVQCARILNELLPGFDNGHYKAFDVEDTTMLPLDQAPAAYRKVLAGSMERVVLAP